MLILSKDTIARAPSPPTEPYALSPPPRHTRDGLIQVPAATIPVSTSPRPPSIDSSSEESHGSTSGYGSDSVDEKLREFGTRFNTVDDSIANLRDDFESTYKQVLKKMDENNKRLFKKMDDDRDFLMQKMDGNRNAINQLVQDIDHIMQRLPPSPPPSMTTIATVSTMSTMSFADPHSVPATDDESIGHGSIDSAPLIAVTLPADNPSAEELMGDVADHLKQASQGLSTLYGKLAAASKVCPFSLH